MESLHDYRIAHGGHEPALLGSADWQSAVSQVANLETEHYQAKSPADSR
jgi:hypothetical protein